MSRSRLRVKLSITLCAGRLRRIPLVMQRVTRAVVQRDHLDTKKRVVKRSYTVVFGARRQVASRSKTSCNNDSLSASP